MDFNTALSGLSAASNELSVISNNIANAGTTGFKTSRTEFSDVYASANTGSSSNSIGSGVTLASVTQQFGQGQIEFTNNNLDLAINGSGFFVLNNNGDLSYTRAGAFGVDNNGYIVDSFNGRLQGFLADSNGNVTGAQGDLQITNSSLPPLATSALNISVNLDATDMPPSSPFLRGFTPSNPPDPSTFNASTSMTVFDSLGNPHVLTNFFVKDSQPNAWKVYIGIDDTDATPPPAALPVGVPPVAYAPGEVPSPFTILFDSSGNYIPPDSSSLPQYYGPDPVTSNIQSLVNAGTAPSISQNTLLLNGVPIEPSVASADVFSTSDNAASAIALASAINQSTNEHGITATANNTVLDLGVPTLGDLSAGDFVINGQNVTGTVVVMGDLLNLINGLTPLTGVTAIDNAGSVELTAADGRNIQIQSDGVQSNGATFANFDLNGGSVLNQVQVGTLDLSIGQNRPIVVGGNNPGSVGFSLGPQAGVVQTSSDNIRIDNWTPTGGAAGPQLVSIDFGSATQYGSPFSVLGLNQNGYSTGQLSGVNIDSNGKLIAQYGNGQNLALGRVVLANFRNTQGLIPVGNTSWVNSSESGPALLGSPATSGLGVIQSGALEQSNVELTNELVKLITSQRNFQANAQTIKTADAITQTIINM